MTEQSVVLSIGVNGRLLLPSFLRTRLNLSEGDRMIVQFEADGSFLKMSKLLDDVGRAQGLYRSFAPSDSIVEELIGERREQAAKE